MYVLIKMNVKDENERDNSNTMANRLVPGVHNEMRRRKEREGAQIAQIKD